MNDSVVLMPETVECSGGQRLTADALVFARPVFVGVLDVRGVLIAELVSQARAEFRVAVGSRNVGLVEPGGIIGRRHNDGVDDGVQVFFSSAEAGEKAALFCEEDRAGDVSLVDTALLEGLAPHLGDALTRGDVTRDYLLATPAHFAPRIYLQGCCEDSHGLSDTLLSVLARRADEICASLEDGIAPAHDEGAAKARQENGVSAGRMAFAL